MNVNTKNKIYFLGDAHFGAQTPEIERVKTEKFIRFVDSIKVDANMLFLTGDIFDFWFEYFNTIPKRFFPILKALNELVQSGTKVYFLGGNHDLWGGNYLRDQVGLSIIKSPFLTILYDKKFYISHGDGILKRNWHYRYFTKPILNSKICSFAFKMIHPDLGCLLARLVSNNSRLYTRKSNEKIEKAYTDFALRHLKGNVDFVVLGHLHVPTLINTEYGTYLNVGNWYYDFSYGVLENNSMKLEFFK
ncbi:UDP-2,3-diacylglucosamine diphosphatase [bacterium]|nr:UDP-2,3-diacylglucosamine diphosphatase [bacterium]